MKLFLKVLLIILGFSTLLVAVSSLTVVFAGNSDYQRCKTTSTCIIGEFLYDDNYQPIVDATCTLTSRDPSGEIFLNSVSMTATTDGWYSYTLDTTGQTEGLYRSQMCCTTESDYLCLDKSFYIGPSYLSTSEVAGAVWNAQPTAYQEPDTFGANLQNPVATAGAIWSYSTRTLSSFGDLISEIWNYSTRSLTSFGSLVADIWNNATRTLTGTGLENGELATKSLLETATQSAVLSIKTTDDYDLGDIIGYVDTLETLVGSASDTSSASTLFGKIKEVKETVDQLTTIDTNIDVLISKWGSYDAEDIYDKVKNLSSEISAINTVSNVSSILSLTQTNTTNMTELKNKVLAMKAVVDVNRTLLEKVSNQPIIKTWLEEGSIVFKTLITNPSTVTSQTVPLKYYLPREIKKENIIKMDDELKIDYDASQEALYVSGEFQLGPNESKLISVEVEDIWKISEEEVNSLRKQAEELLKPLKGTSYFAQGSLVKTDRDLYLEKILRLQKEANTPQGRIRAFREAKTEMQIVNEKLNTMKTLVASAGSMGTMFGFIGGVQTLGVWGLIIVLVAGFVFLAFYIRMLSLQQHNHIERGYGIKAMAVIDFWQPIRPFLNKKVLKIVVIAFFAAGLSLFVINFITARVNKNNLPTVVNTSKEKAATITPTPTVTPKPEKTEQEEIQVNDEKQVLGTATKNSKVKVVVPEDNAVNIRKEPSLNSEVIGKFWLTREVVVISEKDEWVEIKVNIEKDGTKYSDGWVNKKFIEE